MNIQVGARHIGQGSPCFVMAEVGLAHDGSLMQAHAYIDAIRAAGADAAKFQCHLGDPTTEWRVRLVRSQDRSRQDYWRRTGFTGAEWAGLSSHCREVGLEFVCSPFSVEAVRMMDPLLELWKVPSGRVADLGLLDAVGRTGKPALVSSGMSTTAEAQFALKRLLEHGCPVGLMQCTSVYPCPPEALGLPLVKEWHGLSDHSGTIFPGIAAAALGCEVLEVHVCWSREAGGFDVPASVTVEELRLLVEGVRFVETAMRPVDKDKLADTLSNTRQVFM